jgi:hypothetical protein
MVGTSADKEPCQVGAIKHVCMIDVHLIIIVCVLRAASTTWDCYCTVLDSYILFYFMCSVCVRCLCVRVSTHQLVKNSGLETVCKM